MLVKQKISETIIIITVAAFLLFIDTGCRKGEDDPFFSFRSRNNRLCGKWKMVEYSETHCVGTDMNHQAIFIIKLKDGMVVSTFNSIVYESYTFDEIWTFNRDETYKIETLIEENSSITEGTWSWNEKDKKGDYKKKECVLLTPEIVNLNNGEQVYELSGITIPPYYTFALRCLSEKTIIFESEYSEYTSSDGYYSINAEYKLEKVD